MARDTLSKALRSMGYQGKVTPHRFRTMASTLLNEMGFHPDWIERQLAHKETNKIRAAYNRGSIHDRAPTHDAALGRLPGRNG